MKETKIIQVYPSDSAIERAIKEWESFGWEMTDNQKFSDKADLWSPVGTTVRTTTYNKLTFSREKSSPWYSEVKSLEEEYESVTAQISALLRKKPTKKEYGLLDIVLCVVPFPMIPFIIYRIILKVKLKKGLKKYERESTVKLQELNQKAESIRKAAQKIVDAAQ